MLGPAARGVASTLESAHAPVRERHRVRMDAGPLLRGPSLTSSTQSRPVILTCHLLFLQWRAAKPGRNTVIAECYKITQQPDGQGLEPAASITLITYTPKDQREQLHREDSEEDGVVPTTATLVPTIPVGVSVWNMGAFRLKGVTELMKVVQLVPMELEGRLKVLPSGALNKLVVLKHERVGGWVMVVVLVG
ncbi:MAG: hypothetical protein WDW38_001480 [Sanguina aurantia]